MPQRLKVLISAYACEPGKGFEPEVGWQWALQMARFHNVTVLTRANNRGAIDKGLASLPSSQPVPRFIYHDRGPFLLAVKKRLKAIKLYYLLWQKSAHELAGRLHEVHQFDLMHHLTFATFRYPTAVWGYGVAVVWGPVGGIESIPFQLLPWTHLESLGHELLRNVSNLIQAAPYFSLPARAGASSVILASTVEMHARFAKVGFQSEVMPAIGLETKNLPVTAHRVPSGPLRLLYVGNVITLKGIDLALDALRNSETDASLTIIGDGNYMAAARRKVEKLQLGNRVLFAGRMPRDQVLAKYGEFDVFIFPSLHDTGGYAVIEGMLNELPVICLDCGGPAVAVSSGCGARVPLGGRAQVVAGLANAIRSYDKDRATVLSDGKRARQTVMERYDWDQKGVQMDERYRQAVTIQREKNKGGSKRQPRFVFDRSTGFLNRLFSLRGVLMAAGGLVLVAALFFMSLGYLKNEARSIVTDTLPGLSYAGEANASLSQAFNRTLLLLLSESPAERAELEKEVEGFSDRTTAFLNAYKGQIFTEKDHIIFEKVVVRRTDYLRIRDQTFAFVHTNRMAAAVDQCKNQLFPAFKAYKDQADKLFEYNMEEGRSSGGAIMRICTGTQILVAVIGVLIFIAGFLIGVSR